MTRCAQTCMRSAACGAPGPTRPLVEHLVSELAPQANGDRESLIGLCLQVAAHDGAFRAVEKQLQYAAKSRKKKPDLAWPAAFRAAHLRLLRGYSLS